MRWAEQSAQRDWIRLELNVLFVLFFGREENCCIHTRIEFYNSFARLEY